VRYLIVSDIHGNWEGLEAVLQLASGRYDQVLCCGDLVGYGADANRVVEWSRQNVTVIVRGNHDRACAGLDDLEWFNPVARKAALWTFRNLSPANLEYLRNLPRGPVTVENFQISHGSPLDEDEYLIDNTDTRMQFEYLDAPACFYGHTHIQGGFQFDRRGVRRIAPLPPAEGSRDMVLDGNIAYLINPGSVGQPRDHDPRAGFALFYPEESRVTFFRIPYDVASAQRKIREAGLPAILADRLSLGS